MTDHHARAPRPSGSTRPIEEWHAIFTDLPNGAPANAVNCAYRLMGDITGYSERGGHKDTDADQIANAMLAFKRIGSEGQAIYVDSEWVIPFVQFLIEQQLKYALRSEKDEKCEIIFPESFDLRENLPAHLRGKFSMSP
jgi:hypothetical protein